MHLTADQLQHIENLIDDSGINYSHLKADLLDHICCDIEQQMDQGKSFQAAFEQVLLQCSMSHLAHLQKQTLVLTNKVYAFMKKMIHLFGVVVPILLTLGAMGKMYDWHGAGLALVTGFLVSNFVLIPAIAVVSYTEFNNRKYFWAHLSGAVASTLLLTGLLFKIQHWPYANIVLLAGILAVVLNLPVFMVVRRNAPAKSAAWPIATCSVTLTVIGVALKMFRWHGAFPVLMLGLMLVNTVALPVFMQSKEFTTTRWFLAVVLAAWLSIGGGLISFGKFGAGASGYYTHQSELVQSDNALFEQQLLQIAADSIQAQDVEDYLKANESLCRYLRQPHSSDHRLVSTDTAFANRYNRFIRCSRLLLPETAGNHSVPLLKLAQTSSYELVCAKLELIHQAQLAEAITNLKNK